MQIPSRFATWIRFEVRKEGCRGSSKEGGHFARRFPGDGSELCQIHTTTGNSLIDNLLLFQRHKLKAPLTPVTPETFAVWKKTRMDKKKAEEEAKEKAKQAQRAAGKLTGMSGKDMFAFGTEFLGEEDVSRLFAESSHSLMILVTTHLQEEEDDDWDLQQYMANREPAARQEDDVAEENDLRGNRDDDDDGDGADEGTNGDAADVDEVADKLEGTSVTA